VDNLTYELRQLCLRNRDNSYDTQAGRMQMLTQVSRELRELGYRHMRASSLKLKHVEALVKFWLDSGLAPATIKNRLVQVRWWAEKVGKTSEIPKDNAWFGIPDRRFVTNQDKAKQLGKALDRVRDPHVRLGLEMQQRLGLRRKECLLIRPEWADLGDRIRLKASWTKGGRAREIPITTDEQRDVLNRAKAFVGSGSLIPPHRSYIQQRRIYDCQCKAAGLSHMHGLRHAYAQTRYEALTGWKAPAAGGPTVRMLSPQQRMVDRQARQIISRELGHERISITAVYLGR
jgi:hypothetical protein